MPGGYENAMPGWMVREMMAQDRQKKIILIAQQILKFEGEQRVEHLAVPPDEPTSRQLDLAARIVDMEDLIISIRKQPIHPIFQGDL